MRRFTLMAVLLATSWAAAGAADLPSALRKHVAYLASDSRQGRGIGTRGLDQSAQYIAAQLSKIGLRPAFDGSFEQPFTMGWGVTLGPNITIALDTVRLDTSAGIMPLGFSSSGHVRGPAVFAGYGITAPEYNYDDFAGVEATGAIVICMTGEPGEYDTASVFEGVNYTTHSTLRAKAANARLKGAVALLLVQGPVGVGKEPEVLRPPRADEPYTECGIPAVRATRAALARLFPEFDLESLQRFIDANTAPRSLQLKSDSLDVSVELSRRTVEVKNVAGVIPGDTSVIVIGAHYDHLGYGQSGSLDPKPGKVHNGADDNASGVAAVIEVARMLIQSPVKSTVFVAAFTAEETGLGGSSYLVKNFPLDMRNVRAMTNLDMVGRVRNNQLTVLGCNSAIEFKSLVEQADSSVGLAITCKGDGYGPSDNMSFYLADKPVLFLFSGAHEDYHKSTDDVRKINFAGMAQCVELTDNIVRGIDARTEPLTFVRSSEPPKEGRGFRSSLGTIPDFSAPDSLKGVLVGGVREGGAAQQCGLQKGDIVVGVGKVTIGSLYDLMYALQIYAPGDSVEVHFLRSGEEHTTQAVLQSSSR